MEIRFAPLGLGSLGELKTEVLCLMVFEDERPPRGAAGLVDWRLCGRLSTLLSDGVLSGVRGEALLMPPSESRLAAERLLLLGFGARADMDEARFRTLLDDLVTRVLALRVRAAALALPHARLTWLAPERAIDLLLDACGEVSERLDELVLVDTDEAQRLMEPRIERARRRALVDL